MNRTVLNQAQMHILEMAARIKTDDGLDALKKQLAIYYAKRIDEDMDKLWDDGVWNENTLNELKTAHYRTSYSK